MWRQPAPGARGRKPDAGVMHGCDGGLATQVESGSNSCAVAVALKSIETGFCRPDQLLPFGACSGNASVVGDEHCELHQPPDPVQVAKMFFCDGERIERGNARGFLAVLDRRFRRAGLKSRACRSPRAMSAEKEQIAGVGSFNVSPERSWRRGQCNPESLQA